MPAQSAPRALFHYVTDGDNYSPVPRSEYTGQIAEYLSPDGSQVVYWLDAPDIPNAHRNIYLLDNAGDVRAYFVAGWSAGDSITPRAVLLYPMAHSRGRQANAWRMGPRRAYHLILSPIDGDTTRHPDYVPTPERPAARHPLSDLSPSGLLSPGNVR
jgi:hypothetical protein